MVIKAKQDFYVFLPIDLYILVAIEKIMSKERISELRELLYHLEHKIRPLEWDASRHQINEFKKIELERLKQEQSVLLAELKSLEQAQEQTA